MNSQRRDERRFSNTARRRCALVAAALLLASTTGCRLMLDSLPGTSEPAPGERYAGEFSQEGYGFNNRNADTLKDPVNRKAWIEGKLKLD